MSRSDRGDGALFALDAERPEGWFPVQNLKINRVNPVNGPMASIGPYKWGLGRLASETRLRAQRPTDILQVSNALQNIL